MKHASVILLERLLQDLPIKLHDRELTLERTEKDNQAIICTPVRRSILGLKEWETVPIAYEITLADFINSAEKSTQEELFIISSETVLNKINQKKRN